MTRGGHDPMGYSDAVLRDPPAAAESRVWVPILAGLIRELRAKVDEACAERGRNVPLIDRVEHFQANHDELDRRIAAIAWLRANQ